MMRVVADLSEREVTALERARQKAELVAWLRKEAASRDGEMAWYVARTWRSADSVMNELRTAGIEAMCPLERHWKRYPKSRKRYSVDNPLFGNHVFVRLLKAESAWVGILSFEGVDCLLGTGERPVPLREDEIAKVMMMLGKAISRSGEISVGDTVVHPLGAFAELHGTVVEIDGEKRTALVETVLFGRAVATRCGIDDIEKLA